MLKWLRAYHISMDISSQCIVVIFLMCLVAIYLVAALCMYVYNYIVIHPCGPQKFYIVIVIIGVLGLVLDDTAVASAATTCMCQ